MASFLKHLCMYVLVGLPALFGAWDLHAQYYHFPEGQTKQKQLDEAKIHLMGAFASASIESNYPDAEELTRELLAFSLSIKSDEGIADAYSKLARLYTRRRQADTARYFCHLAKNLYKKIDDTRGLVTVICQEGFLEMQANRPEAALQKYQEALLLAEEYFDTAVKADVLYHLGILFLKVGNYAYAENYLTQALELISELDIHTRVRIELNLGNLYNETGEYAKAETHYGYCLNLMKHGVEYPEEMAACNTNLANIYTKQGKYDRALDMYAEAAAYYIQVSDSLNRAAVLGHKAEALAGKGLMQQAGDSLYAGLALVKSSHSLDALTVKARLNRQLYRLYRSTGNYEKALKAYEQQNSYEKEIFSLQTANKMAELKEKFETEQKEQENLALKRDAEIRDLRFNNQSNVFRFFLLAVFLSVIVAILLWRNFKNRQRQRNMVLEQRLLRSQMNPHFIFNALIAIQSFMYKNEPKEAGSFLSSFARLMRSILENSREELIPLDKEMQWLQNYVKLQQLRFENEIDCHITCDPALDVENTWIPPMLVQPFIENALEHGLNRAGQPGQLSVKYTRYKKWLAIHVRDNGSGFNNKTAAKPGREHASMALKITRERLKLINRGKRKKVDLHIFSIPGSGTLVSFSIPLILRS